MADCLPRTQPLAWKLTAARKERSWKRYSILAASVATGMALLFAGIVWVQAERYQECFANQAADTLRQVIGDRLVSNLEDGVCRTKVFATRLLHWSHAKANPDVAQSLDLPLTPVVPAAGPESMPPTISPLVIGQSLRQEGQWRAFAPPGTGMWRTEIRTSVADYWESVDLVAIDLRRLSVRFVPGTDVTGDERASRISPADGPHVVAVFNGGFRPGYDWGMRINGVETRKLHDNMASIVMTSETVALCSWSPVAMNAWKGADVRQNLSLLLDDGIYHNPLPPKRRNLNFKTFRSALGASADGRWLIYACGEAASTQEIATALRLASCYAAAHLDMNPGNVFFDAVRHEDCSLVYTPEEPVFHKYKIAQLMTGSRRDFFYVVAGSRATP